MDARIRNLKRPKDEDQAAASSEVPDLGAGSADKEVTCGRSVSLHPYNSREFRVMLSFRDGAITAVVDTGWYGLRV